MHSFIQNLCVPCQPQLRPLADCELVEQFSLESELFALEEEIDSMGGWTLETKQSEESQEETMEVEEPCFSAKRRHADIIDTSSKRLMFSKLQRMDRAPVKRRHY